jgi:beta-1,4-N-acetylglucosaminyltransferase
MIFLTVGTSFPFDRLIKAVDELMIQGKIKEEMFAQIGKGGYRPKNFESIETLDKIKFDDHFKQADALIAHAGMGTITMALEQNKPILVAPRLKKYRELVNDHQLATAKYFEQLGHVLAVYDFNDLPEKLRLLKSFKGKPRSNNTKKVADRIAIFLKRCL